MIQLTLFQPDIPQNTGAVLRLGACLGVSVNIIEPCGFLLEDKRLKRVGMDYTDAVNLIRHSSWNEFQSTRKSHPGRLVLFTTKADTAHHAFCYRSNDMLLFGQESSGVPDYVHAAADHRVCIPISSRSRSLNLAQAAAIGLSEALRQTSTWPQPAEEENKFSTT